MAKSRGIAFTPEGLEIVRQRMAELARPDKPEKLGWTYENLVQQSGLEAISTVQRALKGQSIDRLTIIKIAQALKLEPSSLVDPRYWNVETASVPFERWQQICETVLEVNRQPNINELLRTDGARFDVEDLFIPLGLVEKKQTKVKRGDIASPEQGSRLYELQQEEVVRRFDRADEFFETVIQGEQSPRIMIIGEPGAGKTTILQTIATQLPDGVLPVWVSLADLQDQTLDEYLFGGDWLKLADRTLPREAGEEFKQLFKEGRVCLLLDGVDEMAVAGGRSQLRVIYEQVRGWEAYVRVIMTCRVNVWEAAPLSEKFQVYRNLPLAYPDQVEKYIDTFFKNSALSGLPEKELKQELESNDRVQDTVKNPLRLALLCHAWVHCGGKLPNTQAKLYELFLEAFYKIKQEQFYIEPDQQKALNQALGQLALEALDREQSWYRIDQVIAQRILGHPEQPGSFFYQALQLGLLNRIGYVAEDPSQECYAFIHPTFQEYLASLSPKIEGWHYFFNHNNENPNPLIPYQGHDCTYRVFRSQWLQIAYFWLERSNLTKELNDRVVSDLWQFNSGCFGFYENNHLVALDQFQDLLESEIFEYTASEDEHGIIDYSSPLEDKCNFLGYNYNYFDGDPKPKFFADFWDLIGLKEDDERYCQKLMYLAHDNCRTRKLALVEQLIIQESDFRFWFGQRIENTDDFIDYIRLHVLQLNSCDLIVNQDRFHVFPMKNLKSYIELVCPIYDFLKSHKDIDQDLVNGLIISNDCILACFLWMLDDLQTPFQDLKSYTSMIRLLCNLIQDPRNVKVRQFSLQYLYNLLHEKFCESLRVKLRIQDIEVASDVIRSVKPLLVYIQSNYYSKTDFGNGCIISSPIGPKNVRLAGKILESVLEWFTKTTSYPQFYKAWNSNSPIHPETAEATAVGSTPQTQQLNNQLLNLSTQLTSTATTHPLCLDLSSLQTLSDRAELCQALALLSYEAIDPSFDTLDIPENIHTPTQLKTTLLKLRKHLKTPKIAIIIHNSDPTPEILDILTVLSPSFPIAWITDQPHPHRSFLPTAANLPQLLQTWLTRS